MKIKICPPNGIVFNKSPHEIRNINSDTEIGYERHFELYQIYNFLDLDASPFLKKAYYLLLDDIKYISSAKDAKYFMNSNVRYNKSILEKWESYNNDQS